MQDDLVSLNSSLIDEKTNLHMALRSHIHKIQGDLRQIKFYLAMAKQEELNSHALFLSVKDSLCLFKDSFCQAKKIYEQLQQGSSQKQLSNILKELEDILYAVKQSFNNEIMKDTLQLQADFQEISKRIAQDEAEFHDDGIVLSVLSKKSERERNLSNESKKARIVLEDLDSIIKILKDIFENLLEGNFEIFERTTRLSLLYKPVMLSEEAKIELANSTHEDLTRGGNAAVFCFGICVILLLIFAIILSRGESSVRYLRSIQLFT